MHSQNDVTCLKRVHVNSVTHLNMLFNFWREEKKCGHSLLWHTWLKLSLDVIYLLWNSLQMSYFQYLVPHPSLSLLHPSLPPSSSSSCVSLLPPFQMGCPHPLRQKCVRRSSCVSLNSVYMCQSDVRRPWCTLKSHAPSPLVLLAHFSALQCCPVKPGTQTNSRELSFTDRSHSHTYSRR